MTIFDRVDTWVILMLICWLAACLLEVKLEDVCKAHKVTREELNRLQLENRDLRAALESQTYKREVLRSQAVLRRDVENDELRKENRTLRMLTEQKWKGRA